MRHRDRRETDSPSIPDALLGVLFGETAGIDQKVAALQQARRDAADGGACLDRTLLAQIDAYLRGLRRARESQAQLKILVEQATALPWRVAIFLRPVSTPEGPRALVACGDDHRCVAVADGIDLAALGAGEPVFLNHQSNLLLQRAPGCARRALDAGLFDRRLEDGRLVLRYHDEEVVVDAAAALAEVALAAGDRICWARDVGMALERIERPADARYRLAEPPFAGPEQVGGQRDNMATLIGALRLPLLFPDTARRYHLDGRMSVLLVGPPGNGKTLLARVAAGTIARLGGGRVRFFVVKPAEWEAAYVGETEQNIRECFAALRTAAEDGAAVLFLDEVEAVGRIRGSAVGHHADRFLNVLLTEIDGFAGRGNVVIVAATNRKDLIDPALLERLSDVEIAVRRPDRRGASEILGVHLPADMPYAGEGRREEVIEVALSRLYAPNAASELCEIRFRDGRTRVVKAHEVASGRLLEQVCVDARRLAANRETEGGEGGLDVADIEEAAARAIERLSSTLAACNVRAYLDDLPQDVDVVGVERRVRRVGRPERYRNAA